MKKNLLLAFLSIVLLSFPWLGDFHGFLTFIAFVPLLFIERDLLRQEKKSVQVFLYAYFVFGIWNLLSFWWGYKASIVGPIYATFVNSFFYALLFWAFHWIHRRFGNSMGYSSFIVFWLGFEYVHHQWDLANPWLTLGNAFAKNVEWIQWYEYTGVLGGSLWIIVINLTVFHALARWTNTNNWRVATPNFVFLLPVFFVPFVVSKQLMKKNYSTEKKLTVTILQPNLDAYRDKYKYSQLRSQVKDLIQLMDSSHSDYYVAPETFLARPFWEHQINDNPYVRNFQEHIDQKKATLIIGASTKRKITGKDTSLAATRYNSKFNYHYQYTNAALLISAHRPIQLHHKSELVMGVEKIPFAGVLTFAKKWVMDFGGVVSILGTDKTPIIFRDTINRINVAPVVCWESVFGELVSKLAVQNTDFITVITNDGWWDNTQGHRQHLHLSKIRAIENRKYVVRSANTGISAFINEKGQVEQYLGWDVKGFLQQEIRLQRKKTFFMLYGDIIGRISVFFSTLLVVYAFISTKVRKETTLKH